MMKKIGPLAVLGATLTLAACHPPPPQPPPGPPPGAMGWGPGGPGMGHGGPMMHHGGGPGACEKCNEHMAGGPMMHEGMKKARKPRGDRGPGGPGAPALHGPPGAGGAEVMRELGALGVHFYPPPMVLKRAQELALTPDQVSKIRAEILGAQAKSIDLKAKAEHAKVEIAKLLAADKPDERAIGAQIDEASKAGAELHKLHMGVMVHVRALLTPDQIKKLDEPKPRRAKGPKPGMGPGGPGGPGMGPGKGPGPRADADDDDDDDEHL